MRSLLSALRLALVSVYRNKLRAALTVLGILVGVAAVVLTAALGTGARARVAEQIERLGSNALMVWPQWNLASGARGSRSAPGLTEGDMKAIRNEATSVAAVSGYARTPAQAIYEDRNTQTAVFGTDRTFFTIRAWELRVGDFWPDVAELSGERVCIIGKTVANDLFGPLDPIGRNVRIGRHPFRVLGVLETKGQTPWGSDDDDMIAMPLATFRSHVLSVPRRGVHAIVMSAKSDGVMQAKAQIESIMRERHHIPQGREPDFVIRSQAEFRAMQDSIYGALSALLLVVGAVSLVVGGIGIMNIMLVSVAERTREIGICMAVGAREGNIMLEFLLEAIVLAIVGGALGTLLALAVIVGAAYTTDWPMRLDPMALLIALATSMTIGVAFGFFPARRAAKLDPIVALRAE